MALSGFGHAFLESLKDLTAPERRSITTLKDLAFENASEAGSVVRAIRQHVKQCPAAHRLAALYLVDCMLKADPCPPVYSEQLSHALLEIFVFAWDHADASTRTSLTKLCKLWRNVAHLDQKVVQDCEKYMVPVGQATTSLPALGGVLRPPAYPGYPVTQPPQPTNAPYGPSSAVVGGGILFPPRMLGQHASQQLAATAPYAAALPLRPMYHAPAPQPGMQLPMYMHAQQPQPHMSYGAPPQQYAYAHPPVHMQFPPGPVVQPAFAAVVPFAPQVLLPPSSPQPGPSSPSPQQPTARPRSTEFLGPQALKELDPSAVQELLDASARTRSAFLDAVFLRNKRRAAQSASGAPSRQWYPSMDLWLVGTTSAPDNDVQAAGQDEAAGDEPDKLYFVEEDPSQPECAISGEAFDRFYDPDSDKWCYKDAVVLEGEDAAKYGVMEGSIVKVQCLAGAPSKLQMATLRAATAASAAADDLRAAAAQPSPAAGAGSSAAAVAMAPAPLSRVPVTAAPSTAPASVAAAAAHPSQPVVMVKEEVHVAVPVGVVDAVMALSADAAAGGTVESTARHGSMKRPVGTEAAEPGGVPVGAADALVQPEAKRVKLEVQ